MTRAKTQVHNVDGSNKGKTLNKSTKWADLTKGQDHIPQRGRTQQG